MLDRKIRVPIDWKAAQQELTDASPTEKRLLALLVDGRTQPEIGRELGLHRSAVWRRVKKLRKRLIHPAL